MIPRVLKNFNLFVDGRGLAGTVSTLTLPKLSTKMEETVRFYVDVLGMTTAKVPTPPGMSEGMVLAASGDAPGLYLLSPDSGAEPGMKVK